MLVSCTGPCCPTREQRQCDSSQPGCSLPGALIRAAPRALAFQFEEDEEEEDGSPDGDGDPCPNCGHTYRSGEFWIQCDVCDRWFDGKCVGMTAKLAEQQPQWKCPLC